MDEDDRLSIDESRPDAPFLGGDLNADDQSRDTAKPWQIATTSRAISTVACVAVFLWVLSGMIIVVPAARLAEDIICRRHYGRFDSDPIDEELCKAKEIQSSMAWIFGLSMSLGTIVGLIAMIPYGVLADRARKPVYLLAATGQFANVSWSLLVLRFWRTLPFELILVGPTLELIGGGLTMALVVLYAIISDANAPEDRAIIYFFSSLAANLAVFIGPPLASFMIETSSPWVPMSFSLLATTLAGSIILLIPETARRSKDLRGNHEDSRVARDQGWRIAIMSQLRGIFSDSNLVSVLRKRSVLLLLLVFILTAPLQLGMGPLFLQYYSKRFEKSIEEAGYMLALRGGLTIIVVGVLLPVLSKYISSSSFVRLSNFRRDLVLAQASAVFAGIGYFLLGGPEKASLISGIVILSLSTGLGPLGRSLISNLVEPSQTSQVFTIASIVEGIGSLPAGPFLAWAFSCGMRLGGVWMGLPFFFLGSLGGLALLVLCFVKSKPLTTGGG
ncbi:MFS general substrate transporter [Xylaria bambusicola]|uniref:MFS general substrate transporter n=1 Tax=Xylaria bambusicola TaxID=326684 RepID=UPI0020080B34|nr:MFS general substrate transporter [Xylaria bambusicola]KAI0516926.1 MFS general substrate transporter [Xylaria bambusicola]